MANVGWIRHELRGLLSVYLTIRDVIEGAEAIKGRRLASVSNISGINGLENIGSRRSITDARRYLPQPNPSDTSQANRERYVAYVERAQWLGATSQTLDGMTGQIFQRDPEATIPTELEPMLRNIDGAGNSFIQQSKRAVDYCLSYGRGGLLADFPDTGGGLNVDQVAEGAAQPVVKLYAPWNIVNWRTRTEGTQTYYCLIVLIDDEYEEIDDFETQPLLQYRVLKLNEDGTHEVEIWRRKDSVSPRKGEFVRVDWFTPLGSDGKPLTRIPFTFFGSRNNDCAPDKPPLQDIAEINIGHYRNSADYEDSCYLLGQPTPWASGLTEGWVKNIWEGKKIALGSRSVIPLPPNAAMGLLQVTENTMPFEAMKHKEAQMVALGAKLIEGQGGGNPKTATGELIDETSETSVLTNVADNVGAAYAYVFCFAAMYMGTDWKTAHDTIKVSFNTEYQFQRMTAAEIQQVVASWQASAITTTEMRNVMRSNGVATLSMEDYEKEADADAKKAADRALLTDPLAIPTGGVPAGNAKPGMAPNPKAPTKKKPSGKGKAA